MEISPYYLSLVNAKLSIETKHNRPSNNHKFVIQTVFFDPESKSSTRH
jgi:hypothetical protein